MLYVVEETVLPEGEGIAIRETHPLDDLPRFFESAFGEMARYVSEAKAATYAGPPFARYHTVPPAPLDVEAIFPLTGSLPSRGRIRSVRLAGGPAIQVMHEGPYDTMVGAYEAIEHWLREHGRARSQPPREVYLTGPGQAPQRTLVVQPLAR
jgi:effector-binding domain-containing protein